MPGMLSIYKFLKEMLKEWNGKDGKPEVVRIKDRFRSSNGYRDILLNVRLPGNVNCEVQLHHKGMFDIKDEVHEVYEITRWLDGANKTPFGTILLAAKEKNPKRRRLMRDTPFTRLVEEIRRAGGLS